MTRSVSLCWNPAQGNPRYARLNDIVGTRCGLIVGDWEVRPNTLVIAGDGCEVKLTPRTMDVLVYLADRAGETVSQQELLTAFWRGAVSSPNAIHKSIAELRHAFGDADRQPVYIETVPKRGYRLVANVERRAVANGTSRSERGTRQPNGEVLNSPSINSSAIVPPNSRKRWVAFGSLIVVVASTMAFLRADDIEGIVVRNGDHSAVLLPSISSSSSVDQKFLDGIRDNLVDQLRATGLTNVSKAHRSNWIGGAIESAGAWTADYTIQIELSDVGSELQASLSIIPAKSEGPSHHERFTAPTADRISLLAALVSHAADDLAVLLDPDQVAQMRDWGTSNVHAYRLAREGDSFQRIQTNESLPKAEDMFRRSIIEDPRFAYGYVSLSAVYDAMALNAKDTATREEQRKKMQSLAREVSNVDIDPAIKMTIERQYRVMSVGNAYELEAFLHAELMRNPVDIEALRLYSRLLVGAGLVTESEAYMRRAIDIAARTGPDEIKYLRSEFATIYDARGDFEGAVRQMKENIEVTPDFTLSLFGLVRTLAKLGRYTEAETYLARLESTDPAWALAARVQLLAQRGELAPGSAQLATTLADPKLGNVARGNICLVVGDVECGVTFYRDIEPAFLVLMWQFMAEQERYWASNVVHDPRYQSLLEELGIGRSWRAHLRTRASELARDTGIEVTAASQPSDVSSIPL